MNPQITCPISLIESAGSIKAQPPQSPIQFNATKWAGYIGGYREFATVVERYQQSVSRSDLRELSREAFSDNNRLREIFIAAMIFGFGKDGRGPYRTNIMLSDLQAKPGMLRDARDFLLKGDALGAHSAFNLRMCRTPYVSKFFYALGLGAGIEPLPLILDSRVNEALVAMHNRGEIDQWRYYTRSKWTSVGYANYVHDMDKWATELGCRSDAIEMYLFFHAGKLP